MKSYNYSLHKKVLLGTLMCVNIALIIALIITKFYYIYGILSFVSLCMYVPLIGLNKHIFHKAMWLLMVVAFPIFGSGLYALLKSKSRYLSARKKYQDLNFRSRDLLEIDEKLITDIKNEKYFRVANYFYNFLDAPVYQGSAVKYFKSGEAYFNEIVKELGNAKKYILIEAYLIREGVLWDKIFEALKDKAREGVEIKILYDSLACKHAFLDKLTFKKLSNFKIECVPFKNGYLGFGNHRRVVVVDGVIGFTGGANISDKYSVDGWSQNGVKITGDTVWNMAVMFFNDWVYSGGELSDAINYKPDKMPRIKAGEYVQPFAVSPLNNREELNKVFINLLRSATREVMITSSHINLSATIIDTLKDMVLGGIKVNIILSNISDKQYDFAVSKSQSAELIKAGINIYEYAGFIRDKITVIDNEILAMGSFNYIVSPLDLMYENGVIINNSAFIKDAMADLNGIMEKSALVTLQDIKTLKISLRFKAFLKNLFK